MSKLTERFDALSRTRAPDLWPDIEHREPRTLIEYGPSPVRRVGIAVLALTIAAVATGFAIRAFQRPSLPANPNPPLVVANGDLYFAVGGTEVGMSYEAISPDGANRRTILPVASEYVGWPQYGDLAWSPDFTKIAFVNHLEGAGLYIANADGSGMALLDDDLMASTPSWSPDGSQIAFSSSRAYVASLDGCRPRDLSTPSGARCPSDTYVINADGSGLRRLTTDLNPEFGPVWSPDGSLIAFTRQGDGHLLTTNIAVMNADGSGLRQVARSPFGSNFGPSWSPDGSSIVYASIRNEDWGIYVTDLVTGREVLIKQVPGIVDDSVWSPDGTQIAYSSDVNLMVMNAGGSGAHRVAHVPNDSGIDDIAWRPAVSSSVPTSSPQASRSGPSSVDPFAAGL